MTHPIANEFQEFTFQSERDELEAQVLNPLQLAYFQNWRASLARNLINQVGAHKDYEAYVEQTIHVKGQFDFVSAILDRHEDAAQQLANFQE